MPISTSLLAKARTGSTKAAPSVAAQAVMTQSPQQLARTIQDLYDRIAKLESRLAVMENAVYVGEDGSVMIYAANQLDLYAEREAHLRANGPVSVSSS